MVEILRNENGLMFKNIQGPTPCVICGTDLKNGNGDTSKVKPAKPPLPAFVLLGHRADRIQAYFLCDDPKCYKALGRRMAQGKY